MKTGWGEIEEMFRGEEKGGVLDERGVKREGFIAAKRTLGEMDFAEVGVVWGFAKRAGRARD